MGLQLQNVITKLPRSLLFLEGSCFRGFFKLSSAQSADRTYSCFGQSRSKDFRFPLPANASSANFSHAGCPLVLFKYPNATTKHGMIVCHRNISTNNNLKASDQKKSLVEAKESPYAHLTPGQKVKEVGKDASYTLVILVGIAVTGFMFYVIGRELFSSQSPSGVYGEALTKCQNSIEVTAALGEPIKGYGETTRRGRRRHVSHTEFDVNGVPHMRLRFYIEGPYKKGTVHVEVQKGDSGKYEYRYLVVETEGYPHRTFVLEDNR